MKGDSLFSSTYEGLILKDPNGIFRQKVLKNQKSQFNWFLGMFIIKYMSSCSSANKC